MNKWMKRLMLACLCLSMTLGSAPLPLTPTKVVEAAVRQGWSGNYYYKDGKKVTGWQVIDGYTYYFTSKGKVVKNSFKSRKVAGGKQVYYLGKNGAAYQAEVYLRNGLPTNLVNFKTYKIGGTTYAFDRNGFRCTGVWMANGTGGKLYAFKTNGKYDSTATKSLRKLYKKYYHVAYKKLLSKVEAAFGKPLEVTTGLGCLPFDYDENYPDTTYLAVTLKYPHLEVSLVQNERTKVYYLEGIYPVTQALVE